MPSQVSWTIDNLPDIIYQWKPTAANVSTGKVGLMPYLIFGKALRNFDVLPDRISSNVEPWLLQAWFRLDSRISWGDITDRIEPTARPKWNAINMDCVRLREDFFMRPWSASKGVSTQARDEDFERVLRKAGLDPTRNTTRGLTPGLIDPLAGPNSARIPVPLRWTKQRKQRKAEIDTVVDVKDIKAKPSLRFSSRRTIAGTGKAMESEADAQPHGDEPKGASATMKISPGDIPSLDQQTVVPGQTLEADKEESASVERLHKRKAGEVDELEADEERAIKRKAKLMAKSPEISEGTPRKRKATGNGEAEQTEEERPRKLRRVRSQVVKELVVEKGTEGSDTSLEPEKRSVKYCIQNDFHLPTFPSASPELWRQHTNTGNSSDALSEEQHVDHDLDVGPKSAYIGYLQAPVVELEADNDEVKRMRREALDSFESDTIGQNPFVQSPTVPPLDFWSYEDMAAGHSTDPSLPSALMTPQDLGEDMMSSAPSTQLDPFGDCMADEFDDFLQCNIYDLAM